MRHPHASKGHWRYKLVQSPKEHQMNNRKWCQALSKRRMELNPNFYLPKTAKII